MEKWKAKYASHFPTPSTAERYRQNSLRYTNYPTGTKDRARQFLFCGINPGLYSAATKHHFARPGNRFWPALHLAKFTPRLLAPNESGDLLELGYGITSLVRRATATAREVTAAELVAGRRRLARTVSIYRPCWVAVLGVGAYRVAFGRPRAEVGPQQDTLGDTGIWLLPSPSGANGSYPLVDLCR